MLLNATKDEVTSKISSDFLKAFEELLSLLSRRDFDFGYKDKAKENEAKLQHAVSHFGSEHKLIFKLDEDKNLIFDMEKALILEFTKRYPSWSYIKINNELNKIGFSSTAAKVQYLWDACEINSKQKRYKWISNLIQFHNHKISLDEQRKMIKYKERADEVFVSDPAHEGEVLAHKLFHINDVKGVGTVYVHVWVDVFTKKGFFFPTKTKMSDIPLIYLCETILPHYCHNQFIIKKIVTDKSKELYGKSGRNKYSEGLKEIGIRQIADCGQKSKPILAVKKYYSHIYEALKEMNFFDASFDGLKEFNLVLHTLLYERGMLALSDQEDPLRAMLLDFYDLRPELTYRWRSGAVFN